MNIQTECLQVKLYDNKWDRATKWYPSSINYPIKKIEYESNLYIDERVGKNYQPILLTNLGRNCSNSTDHDYYRLSERRSPVYTKIIALHPKGKVISKMTQFFNPPIKIIGHDYLEKYGEIRFYLFRYNRYCEECLIDGDDTHVMLTMKIYGEDKIKESEPVQYVPAPEPPPPNYEDDRFDAPPKYSVDSDEENRSNLIIN